VTTSEHYRQVTPIDHFTDTVKLSPFAEKTALSAHDGGVELLSNSHTIQAHYPGT